MAWIEIKPGRYFSAIWFRRNDGRIGSQGDVLAALFRDPGKRWEMVWRLRWYRDEKDDKNGQRLVMTRDMDEEEARRIAVEPLLVLPFSDALIQLDLRTDDTSAITDRLHAAPFFHGRTEEGIGDA